MSIVTTSKTGQKPRGFSPPAARRPKLDPLSKNHIAGGAADPIQRILATCPQAGQGVNRWLMGAARKLYRLGLNAGAVGCALEDGTSDCGRVINPSEIERVVQRAHPDAPQSWQKHEGWPEKSWPRIEGIASRGITVAQLQSVSPVKFGDGERHSEAIIDQLFPSDPFVCAARELFGAYTIRRSQWRGQLFRQQFIVPSPMTKIIGLTQEGKPARRCDGNTGPRRFLVIEFDFKEYDSVGRETDAAAMIQRLRARGRTVADASAALHEHLASLRPLAMVVHSGGKSLHGWYPCAKGEEQQLRRFMRLAVSLGADKQLWTRSQLVRMPDGTRSDGTRQRVLYFAPSVIGGAE